MKPRSLAQLLLFMLIAAFWLKIAWPLMTKEVLALGAVGGLTIHWALTNKGKKAVALIEPGTSGWRVMLYDMMLVAFLAALIQQNGTALLDALKNSVQNSALLLALAGGIGIDYSVGGEEMKRFGLVLALLVLFATGTVSAVGVIEDTGINLNISGGTEGPIWFPYLIHYNDGTGDFYYIAYMHETTVPFVGELTLSDGSTVTITADDFQEVQRVEIADGKDMVRMKLIKNLTATPVAVHWTSINNIAVDMTYPVLEALSFALVKEGQSFTYPVDAGTVEIYAVFSAVDWDKFADYQDEYFDGIRTSAGWHLLKFTDSDGTVSVSDAGGFSSGAIMVAVMPTFSVQFSLKDALSGQALSGVTVKENGNVLGTLDDGGSLELAKGTHTLTFEKSGYWSVTKTIDVQGDMSVSVEMYPDSAAFKLENFPADISIPENTIYELTFTLSPISTQATYNTYLSLSGLSNVLEVRKDGQTISPENGKYYLGDISSPAQISIKFKAGAVGTHGFTITLTSNDAIMSQTYTTTKQVTYTVEPLPFSVQMPSEWQVGTNELRISESSGQSYLVTAVLKDSQGNEVWSDSYAFSPYEAHTFTVNVPAEGSYTLELTWNGQTAVYSVQVNPAITLKTKTLTVEKGGEGTIILHFKNPSSSVQYYTIKVSGGFLPKEINQSISVAPLAEKDVSIAFAVPEDLTYDAYELQVQVLQGNSVVFSDKVAVTIGDSGGFALFGGGSSTSTWAYALLGLLVLGGLVWALRRRR